MTRRCRVLVVDDSAFARKVLREILTTSPAIDVIGTARDGLEALEKIAELQPDVVTLDLMMPNLDGGGVLRALAGVTDPPRVVIVSMSGDDSELAIEALALGALELVRKPTALATDRLYELSAELIRKVLAVDAARRPRTLAAPRAVAPTVAGARGAAAATLIVIGTSTGGPQALARLLADLPGDLPAPVMIALHIPRDYTAALAQRLDALSSLRVVEARDGLELTAGLVALAPGGSNLRVERAGGALVCRVAPPDGTLYVPSVDVLFTSAASAAGAGVLAVVLTGMGDDGLIGGRAVHAAGGRILVEAEASCVVYGMPRCVREAGLASEEAALPDMAAAIVRRAR